MQAAKPEERVQEKTRGFGASFSLVGVPILIETKWRILKWNGANYVLDAEIPAPNKSFKEELKSNITETKLVDGSSCFESPLVKTTPKAIAWTWLYVDTAFKIRLMTYASQRTRLKVECKNASEAYDGDFYAQGFSIEGFFLDVSAEWVIGKAGDGQLYEVTVGFQIFEF